MARLTTAGAQGDPPKVVEDKIRNLPANQGVNESAMWTKIDTEIGQARADGSLREVERYNETAAQSNKHGN